jgi:hypothetical protein
VRCSDVGGRPVGRCCTGSGGEVVASLRARGVAEAVAIGTLSPPIRANFSQAERRRVDSRDVSIRRRPFQIAVLDPQK